MIVDQLFTSTELRQHDGDDYPAYIAVKGIVYDVSDCPRWRSGLHEHLHFPGQDLTNELFDAPHSDDVLARPCVKRIGRVIA